MLTTALARRVTALRRREEGVTMIEYGLLAALIAVALIVTIVLVKDALIGTFSTIANAMS